MRGDGSGSGSGSGSSSSIGGNIATNTTGDNAGTCPQVSIAGVEVAVCQPLALFVGIATGLQTDQSVAGSCVYASVSLIVMGNVLVDTIIKTFTDFSKLGDWYSAIVMNPIHFSADSLAYYEYCNMSYILDIIKSFVAIDVIFLTDYIIRVGMGAFLVIPGLLEKFKTAVQGSNPNYLLGGQVLGEIITQMTQVMTNS